MNYATSYQHCSPPDPREFPLTEKWINACPWPGGLPDDLRELILAAAENVPYDRGGYDHD